MMQARWKYVRMSSDSDVMLTKSQKNTLFYSAIWAKETTFMTQLLSDLIGDFKYYIKS